MKGEILWEGRCRLGEEGGDAGGLGGWKGMVGVIQRRRGSAVRRGGRAGVRGCAGGGRVYLDGEEGGWGIAGCMIGGARAVL